MQKKKSAVPAYLGVAAVWIGSHFGPGFATGAFSVRWYVKYGWIGLITPLLAMLVTGGVMYYMLEYAREHGTPNYRPFARACYGEKLGGVVAVLYDICFLMTMMCAGGLRRGKVAAGLSWRGLLDDCDHHHSGFRGALPLWLEASGQVLRVYDVRDCRRRSAHHGSGADARGQRRFRCVRKLRRKRQGHQLPARDFGRDAVWLLPVDDCV